MATGAPWERGSLSIDLDAERARVIRALAAAMKGNEASRAKLSM